MIFAKLDVSVYSHRRFAEAGFEAVGYWALVLAYLRHQESEDGFLSSHLIGVPLGAGIERCLPLCEKLVLVGLFRKVDDGYFLVNYAEKNETKDAIESRLTPKQASGLNVQLPRYVSETSRAQIASLFKKNGPQLGA